MNRRTSHIRGLGWAILVVVTCGSAGWTQTGRAIEVSAAGSVGLPREKLETHVQQGYGGSLGLNLASRSVSPGAISFGLNLNCDLMPADRDDRADLSFLAGGLGLRLSLANPHSDHLYLSLIGGWSRVGWSEIVAEGRSVPSVTESGPFLSPGLGLAYKRTGLSPFVQLEYVVVSGTRIGNYEFLRISAGARL